MFYPLSKLLWPLAQPSNLLLLGLVLAALDVWRGRRRAVPLLVGIAAVLGLLSFVPVGQWLLLPLENRFPPPADLPEQLAGVVMLGGSVDARITAARGTVALQDPAERATTLLALARRYPAARLVVSGGGGPPTEAQLLLRFFREQQLSPARVEFEDRARNTHENAVFSHALARPRPGERWLLVTSAAHMPRAVGCFERVGWPVIAYPVDYRTTGHFKPLTSPDFATRLQELDEASRAWLGLVVYRLTGRTSALLPGP